MRSVMAFAATLAATFVGIQQAHAFCTPGQKVACTLNGKHGTQTCGRDGMMGPCIVPPDPPPPSCTAQPKYKILTVVYAPPGHQGGGSTSSVAYGAGSSMGTTSSTSNGFKQSYSVGAQVKSGVFNESSLSLSYSRNAVDTTSEDFKKTANSTLTQVGPTVDGIDHNRDEIWLWLGPKFTLKMPSTAIITWEPIDNQTVDIQFAYVGWLKDPSQMPQMLSNKLAAYGITTADYAVMLQADPFAFGDVPVDPARYSQLNTTFPYEPPFAPGDPPPTLNFTATHTTTHTFSTSKTNEYGVAVTLSVGIGDPEVFRVALKTTDSWTWTDTHSNAEADGTSDSASVTIGGPAFGYTGPTDVAVYYDEIYKSFLFKFVPGQALGGGGEARALRTEAAAVEAPLQGVVVSASGAPVAGREVVLIAGGVPHRTFTNADGEFRIFGATSAATQLRVDGAQTAFSQADDWLVISVP